MRRRTVLLVMMMVLVILVTAGAEMLASTKPAEAAFPGQNGKIYFERDRSVWAMNPDGTGQTELLGINDTNTENNPAVSPDGAQIAYAFGNRDIHVMNADGGGVKRITTDGNFNQDPAWSPDNKRIVFSGKGLQNWQDLFVVNSDGTGRRNLTNTPDISEEDPAWSPDGSQIAYTAAGCDRGGGTCVFVMAADGTQHKNLTDEPRLAECPNQPAYRHLGASSEPNWSPDGSQIVFDGTVVCPNYSGTDIWVMDADGGSKKNLTNDNGTLERYPIFSPDGTQIAFQSDRDDIRGDIHTMKADDGTNQVNITHTDGFDEAPDWGVPSAPSNVRITRLNLNDIDNQPLRFLSTDNHPYFGGNTRIHGSITIEGSPQDELASLELEIRGGGVTAKADLSAAAQSELLNEQFGPGGQLSFSSRSEPLLLLPASRAELLDSPNNGDVELRVVAQNQAAKQAEKTFGSVPRLVRYDRPNRYGSRGQIRGGDDWVLPTVRGHAAGLRGVIAGTLWGDFSNMNGGPFPPHASHQQGTDVDGDYQGYDERTVAVAHDMLSLLRNRAHGTSIERIFVTFNAPGAPRRSCEGGGRDTDHSAFWRAIQRETVPNPGGGTRQATAVIRPVASHCGHFHIRFSPN